MSQVTVDEGPTPPRKRENGAHAPEGVTGLIPLDVIPILVIPRADVPWKELSELATQLVTRIDGKTHAMTLVMGTSAAPNEGIRELAALADRGLVRWGSS
jgi:hypothetical protein